MIPSNLNTVAGRLPLSRIGGASPFHVSLKPDYLKENKQALARSLRDVLGSNSQAAESIAEWIQSLNSDMAGFAVDTANSANARASDWSTSQGIDLNRQALDFAQGYTSDLNRDATRRGTSEAIESSADVNEFAALNAAFLNNTYAAPAAAQAATMFNTSVTQDVKDAMSDMFGAEDFADFQRQVNQNIQDHLSGKVSQSTRRQIARRAISSGATELGDSSVDDFATGYLGLTSEDLRSRGQQEYQSLYGLYRQSVPIVSGASLMPQYGISGQQISAQTAGLAAQLGQRGSITARDVYANTGVSNQQLLGMSGVSAGQLFGNSAFSATQAYSGSTLPLGGYFGQNSLTRSGYSPGGIAWSGMGGNNSGQSYATTQEAIPTGPANDMRSRSGLHSPFTMADSAQRGLF